MGVVSGLSLLGAFVALILHDYRAAEIGIIVCSLVFLLLFIRRHRERRRRANEPPNTP
jgi:hypothetical protein